MNKNIARRWVKALRSGKYKQGREALKTPQGTYCCLGVLCDVAKRSKQGHWNAREFIPEGEISGSRTTLPGKIQSWAGVDPMFEEDLIIANDRHGTGHKTFKGIAKMIEKEAGLSK